MAMRPLIINDSSKAAIREVITYAEANRFSFADLQERVRTGEHVGDDPRFTCIVPFGFRCCFSIEEQPPPLGWCRHLSVSVPAKGRIPNTVAMDMLCKEFGFREGFNARLSYLEDKCAVNVIEPIEGEVPR